ncbi:unnamed protein product [Allacma fusca]|uniref:Uncharacterized protein n=1 Tax=Allacma fusca TaxID=39272 RepID=A0A8J2JYX4_9HEXA|nr:unnamed protein product [Allacma fusca]
MSMSTPNSEIQEISLFDMLEDLTEEDPFYLYNLAPNPDEDLHTPSESHRKRVLEMEVSYAPEPEPEPSRFADGKLLNNRVSVISMSAQYQEFFDSLDFLEDRGLNSETNMGINFSSLLWKSGTDPMIGNFDNEHLKEESVSLTLDQHQLNDVLNSEPIYAKVDQAQDKTEEPPSVALDAYIKTHLEGFENHMDGNLLMLESESGLGGPASPGQNIEGGEVNDQSPKSPGFAGSSAEDLRVVDVSLNKRVRLVSPRLQETSPDRGFILRSSHLGTPDTVKTIEASPEMDSGKKRKLDMECTSLPKSPYVRLVRLTNAEIRSAGKKSFRETSTTGSHSSSSKRRRRSTLVCKAEKGSDQDYSTPTTSGSGARNRGRGCSSGRKSVPLDSQKNAVSVDDGEIKYRRGKRFDASYRKNCAKSSSEEEIEDVTVVERNP